MSADRYLFLDRDPDQHVIRKLRKEQGEKSEFWIETSLGKEIKGRKTGKGYPPIVFFQHEGRVRFAAELLGFDPRNSSRLKLSNVQRVDIQPKEVDVSSDKIAQKYGSVNHYLRKVGFTPENQSTFRENIRETDESSSKSEGLDLTNRSSSSNSQPASTDTSTEGTPKISEVVVERVDRDAPLVKRLKEEYDHTCQVCSDKRYRGTNEPYAEGHHIKPLRPDDGPDIRDNIIILCPNHHSDFDFGMIGVDPETFEIKHQYEENIDGTQLQVKEDHNISQFLEYHNDRFGL